ncbi:hypothetical protein DPMN_185105 [Dreissena polymorpha]|uniref:Uncharacterized protein n=1 Tax=Dreissena polymorpha TaxID=45954 RepID=A0A9D4I810_DREPO|nr:hypothetical protein DPMN_185105 [Dreissena polymorpha]
MAVVEEYDWSDGVVTEVTLRAGFTRGLASLILVCSRKTSHRLVTSDRAVMT